MGGWWEGVYRVPPPSHPKAGSTLILRYSKINRLIRPFDWVLMRNILNLGLVLDLVLDLVLELLLELVLALPQTGPGTASVWSRDRPQRISVLDIPGFKGV